MKKAELILKKFTDIKTVPHIAIRLTQMIAENTGTMQEFEDIIKLDPALVMRLLELVNSSYYSLRKKINSVAEALVFVGMNNLRNMIVEYQVIQELFLTVCEVFMPKAKQINEYEQDIIGTDHTKIGAILVSNWKLPENIQSTIKNHHKINIELLPDSIPGIIRISEYLVSRIGHPELPGAVPILPKSIISHLRENISDYKLITRDLPGELIKAREILDLNEE